MDDVISELCYEDDRYQLWNVGSDVYESLIMLSHQNDQIYHHYLKRVNIDVAFSRWELRVSDFEIFWKNNLGHLDRFGKNK